MGLMVIHNRGNYSPTGMLKLNGDIILNWVPNNTMIENLISEAGFWKHIPGEYAPQQPQNT